MRARNTAGMRVISCDGGGDRHIESQLLGQVMDRGRGMDAFGDAAAPGQNLGEATPLAQGDAERIIPRLHGAAGEGACRERPDA